MLNINLFAVDTCVMFFDNSELEVFGYFSDMDKVFNRLDSDSVYVKMYKKFRTKMEKTLGKIDEDNEIEDNLATLIRVVNDFTSKIFISLIRSQGTNDDMSIIEAIKSYLSDTGFYSRMPGSKLSDEDFEDMQILMNPDEGKKDDILVIERLPYYVDFEDEDGDSRKLRMEGTMIVSSKQ